MILDEFFAREKIAFYRELAAADLLVFDREKYRRIEEEIGGVESAVIFLIPYYTGQKTTNLSIYAQPRDYHWYLRELCGRLQSYLMEKQADLPFMGFTDTAPISERDAALKAGLGFLGENGLVLNEVYGSLFFIGEFFLARAQSPAAPAEKKTCPRCGRCKAACPTGAILDPERKRCLSLLSQKKDLTPDEKALVDAAPCKWGCDLCQNVCPFNENAALSPIPFFQTDLVERLDREAVEAPKDAFRQRAYAWRGRNVLRRNLAGEKPEE